MKLRTLRPRFGPKPSSGWQPDSRRGSRHERGYGTEWEKLRKRILERDSNLCQQHLSEGLVVVGNQVDHTIPKSQGGTDHESNLKTLCEACHRAKTQRESRGGGSTF